MPTFWFRFAPAVLKATGLIVFLYILLTIDYREVLSILCRGDLTLLLTSFPLLLIAFGAKTLRFQRMVRLAGISLSFQRSWQLYMMGNFFSLITPGRVGELGRTVYLTREGVETRTAISVSLIDRLADLLVLAVLCSFSIGVLFGIEWSLLGFLGFALGAAGGKALLRWAARTSPRSAWLGLPWQVTRPPQAGILAGITAIAWVFHVAWVLMLAGSLRISLPLHVFASIILIVSAVSALPIAPAGLGTRDAALIFFMSQQGTSPERAAALALLMLLSILTVGGFGLFYWLATKRSRVPEA